MIFELNPPLLLVKIELRTYFQNEKALLVSYNYERRVLCIYNQIKSITAESRLIIHITKEKGIS